MDELEEVEKIIKKMKIQLTNKIDHFHYSKVAKIPLKVHSFIEIMNLRMIDFSDSVQILLRDNKIVPAIPLIRSLMENVAITDRVVEAVKSSLSENKLVCDFDDLMTKIKLGTRYSKDIVSISILTQIDKLDKRVKGVRKYYDCLCEFTHPNWDGVEGSYSELDEINRCTYVQKVISKEHPLMNFFQSCFLLIINVFLGLFEWLKKKLPEFTKLCELDLLKKEIEY